MNDVDIIIVHWNTPGRLKQLLTSLTIEKNLRIIVIDNNSEKKLEWVTNEFPHVLLINNPLNRGYASACNQGALLARSEWILFLNPDVLLTIDQIAEALQVIRSNKWHAASFQSESQGYEKPLPSTISILSEFTPLRFLIPRFIFRRKTLFGGALFIKRTVLMELGGWDEKYFLWFEDSELTKQLIDRKYHTGRIPIKVSHSGGESFSGLDKQTRNAIFFMSLRIYSSIHFNAFSRLIVKVIARRFTQNKILPILNSVPSLVIPNMNREILKNFLHNNHKSIQPIYDTIVVSSALNVRSIWFYRKKYPGIRFILLSKNRGFAHTVNIGMRIATGTVRATVNDDTQFDQSWIRICAARLDEKIGSANPLIQSANGQIESAGIDVEIKGKAKPITFINSNNQTSEVTATNAAAVVFNTQALQKTGLFDEQFGSYLEDIDLSLRMKRKGYIHIVCHEAKVIHVGHATSKDMGWRKNWLDMKNWYLVILKNWNVRDFLWYFPAIASERLRNISGLIKAKWN